MALAVAYDFFDAVLFNLGCRWFRKPKNIAGQVVLITGAGSGLGRKLAEYFATTKCRLVLWDIDEKGNEETKRICEELGVETHTYRVDVSEREAVYAAAQRVFSEVGDVEILVNNAGIARDAGPFLDKKDEVMQKIIEVNMLSHIWMAKAFLPKMIERDRGHIVCICSLGGIVGAGQIVDYSASKFGAFGFQEALENELSSKSNIQFTTVCPSFIDTPMVCDNSLKLPSHIPLLSADEVAEEILYTVLTNRRIVVLPRKACIIYFLKGVLPRRVFQRLLFFK
ncbi:hypothetical protein Q1695_009655 [Nippostrongylus brasiliensis]|nr:hypothetical protein Q1695_009655 [Nippostrongylus brasiliensis]